MGAILAGLVLAVIAGGLIGAAIYFLRQDKRIKQVLAENADWKAHVASVEAENQRLAPYAVVPDADIEAARIIAEANQKATEIAVQMKAYEEQVAQWGESTVQAAHTEEALSRQKKEQYETVATAMRNIIEGYGNQYLIPAPSLLDDLARDFGFMEAGEQLKKARAATRVMVKDGKAATSGYPDKERRVAASSFVLDGFNGKVDTILASAKMENVGILEQKIKDAFTLVNEYGRTFGDTRITQVYLKARLEELRWAARAQQLRLDEKEEQRRIKEQMREEEKARREIEKAQRDAAKVQEEAVREQALLHKALEKARAEAAHVGEEQRAAYEQKMREMEERLQEAEARRLEAEEKGKCAISMARQTKRGHVYIISNVGSFGENVYKIGQTRRLEPLERIWELGDASVPFQFDVHAMILSEDAPGLEYQLHKHFVVHQINKVNPRKEFFRVDLADLRKDIEGMGLDVKWTMTAEAGQYRETLKIEESIKTDSAFREEWMKKQVRLKMELPALSSARQESSDMEDEEGEAVAA